MLKDTTENVQCIVQKILSKRKHKKHLAKYIFIHLLLFQQNTQYSTSITQTYIPIAYISPTHKSHNENTSS